MRISTSILFRPAKWSIILIFCFAAFIGSAQNPDSPDDVIFVNTGAMNIAAGGTNGVALYVPFGMRQTGSGPSIKMNGQANLGGNFYQDATSPVFTVDATTTSLAFSAGTFRFVKDWGYMRVLTSNFIASTYDRGTSFVAFPNILLATNDSIRLAARMGIDAKTFKRAIGKTGKMILSSDRYGSNVFDASMRVTGTGASASLVDLGSVIVEREMSYYRSTVGTEKLFGFATPYLNTMLSGYYAGNWVRRPVANPTTGHTQFVFGNEQDGNGVILSSQYIWHPLEKLVPGQAYLIKPRPPGFTYQDLRDDKNGLTITDGNISAGAYDQTKFIFNGKVYSLDAYEEQLYAEDFLYQSPSITSTASTINWLVGNSFTAPIGTQQLIDAMAASPLRFSPFIWVYPAGSATYQSYRITGTENIIVEDLEYIPAMSVFMLRILSGTSPGQFNITKSMQRHAKVTHSVPVLAKRDQGRSNAPAADSKFKNQILFKVMPDDNPLQYDRAAIGLRQTASRASDSFDMTKILTTGDNFLLYSLSSTNAKLSANGMPLDVDFVKLCFKPVSDTAEFVLDATYQETLTSEGVWLEDTKDNVIIDLKETNSYGFTSYPADSEERFLVHFKRPINLVTNIGTSKSNIQAFTVNERLIIKNIKTEDIGSLLYVFDVSGKTVISQTISNYPELNLPFNQASGIYLIQIKGERNDNLKVLKK
jgi:hypothetical protein